MRGTGLNGEEDLTHIVVSLLSTLAPQLKHNYSVWSWCWTTTDGELTQCRSHKSRHTVPSLDCVNNGRSIRDVTQWFVDCCFEASSLNFGCRHLVFLEPKVNNFGEESDTELIVDIRLL